MSAYKPLLILTLILYTFSTLHYLVFIVYQNERVEKLTKATFRAAVVFHLLSIVARWLQAGYFPVTSLHESLLFYSFLVALGYILLESRFKTSSGRSLSIAFEPDFSLCCHHEHPAA